MRFLSPLNETQTRQQLIDQQLARAGWVSGERDFLTEYYLTGQGKVGESREDYASFEPGFADYVLLGKDGKPMAIVEAKRTSRDAIAGKRQASDYADQIKSGFGFDPFIFGIINFTKHKKESILDQLELAAICIKRFYCGMAPEYKKRRLMVTLQAFIDDSYDESTFALGGFIAPIEVWDKFSDDWVSICKEPPGIGYYRTNDAISCKKSFASFSNLDLDVRSQKIAKLASTIPTEKLYGISAHLTQSDLKEINDRYRIKAPSPYNFPYCNPYFVCASCIIAWICINCESLFPGIVKKANEIDFIFDEQEDKTGRKFRTFFDVYMRSRPPYLPRLGKCDHWDDQKFPPLQAADMYASWIRRGATSKISMWTAADIYLSNIESRTCRIDRTFFDSFENRLKNMGLKQFIKY